MKAEREREQTPQRERERERRAEKITEGKEEHMRERGRAKDGGGERRERCG